MKKTNFWKGLALAAVALVGVYTTSCSEEELKINGGTIDIPTVEIPELAAPVAEVAITVVNFENGQVLSYEVKNISTNIGGSYEAVCPVIEGYTTAKSVTFNVAAMQKGQVKVYPITFYVVSLNSALKEVIEALNPAGGILPTDPEAEVVEQTLEATAEGALGIEDGVIVNDGDVAVEMTISIPYKSGYEYRAEESRAISASDIARLKAETKIFKKTITVNPGTAATINATQNVVPVILTIDDAEYKLWFFEELVVEIESASLSHGGDHGHGHGNGNNTGGGTADAE